MPQLPEDGTFVGRIWSPEEQGPAVVLRDGGELLDLTSSRYPTLSVLLEEADAVAAARAVAGTAIASMDDVVANSREAPDPARPYFLPPCDLQPIKACGVTFATSMLERVIEERAKGDPDRANDIRASMTAILGHSLRDIVPGSEKAMALKEALIGQGMWSQYLEVGIGPDPEVFTKAPAMASVGFGAAIGLHPISVWNNPEPEITLAVNRRGEIKGATLGNDVNLRDVEGRSALLLGKAKDNNASCALGPMLRLFDAGYGLDDVRRAELSLTVTGDDGYVLQGASSMREISRDPEDLVRATIGAHHQYPDGLMLMLGTLFAPTDDRDEPGGGFTHKLGDRVEISEADLGRLVNTVRLATECPPWTFGTTALMRNLAARGLL